MLIRVYNDGKELLIRFDAISYVETIDKDELLLHMNNGKILHITDEDARKIGKALYERQIT